MRVKRGLIKDDDPKPAVPTADQQAAENEIFAALAKKKAENAGTAARGETSQTNAQQTGPCLFLG